MAEVILNLFDAGLDADNFHIVAHSLGAQMSGIIGRNVIKKSGGDVKIARISGLDPAFPSFYPSIGTSPINKKDAKFVDIIHTDAWLYGAPISTGTIDFWPNGGRTLQPGCPRRTYKALSDNGNVIRTFHCACVSGIVPNLSLVRFSDLCSHRRSWWFWAESVRAPVNSAFHAVQAKSWDDFKKGRVDESTITHMGIDCSTRYVSSEVTNISLLLCRGAYQRLQVTTPAYC